MATKNEITGDTLITKSSNKKYDDGWERIFGKKKRHTYKDSLYFTKLEKETPDGRWNWYGVENKDD
jgi:hypothetical protein